jgi:malate dehydrogenase (oxaloacetate-decarboxylating)
MLLEGCTESHAKQNIYIIDVDGLVHTGQNSLAPELSFFARDPEEFESDKVSLLDVVNHAQPSVLIGVCAQPNMFTEAIVKKMASYCKRPIILPLSNPTSRSEAHPQNLIYWTEGKALIATGSPFDPVIYNDVIYPIAQCNNVYIFPGIGLGAIVSGTHQIIDEMFIAAARSLSEHSPKIKDPSASLFPELRSLRKVSREIALSVISFAQHRGLCAEMSREEMERKVDTAMWFPEYPHFTS